MKAKVKNKKVVIGIDPGVSKIGIAAIDSDGTLMKKTTIKLQGEERGDEALIQFLDFIEELANEIEDENQKIVVDFYFVIEEYAIYGLKASVVNAFKMGQISQAIRDTIKILRMVNSPYLGAIETSTVRAVDMRRYLTGNPQAKTTQIKEALKIRGYDFRMNEHERDALGLALYWLIGLDNKINKGE